MPTRRSTGCRRRSSPATRLLRLPAACLRCLLPLRAQQPCHTHTHSHASTRAADKVSALVEKRNKAAEADKAGLEEQIKAKNEELSKARHTRFGRASFNAHCAWCDERESARGAERSSKARQA